MRYEISTKADSTIIVEDVERIGYDEVSDSYGFYGKDSELLAMVPVGNVDYIRKKGGA